VLNNKRRARNITAATKAVIHQAAREMEYRPNLFARSLRARRSFMVGLLIYDILDPYCAPLIKHIEIPLIKRGYTMLISDLGNDPKSCQRALDTLMDRRVDGIIFVANQLPIEKVDLSRTISSTPLMLIGRRSHEPRIPHFVVNEAMGGYIQGKFLISRGHRQIAFIWDGLDNEWSQLRWKGVMKAMTEAGVMPELVSRADNNSADAGYQAMQQLLERKQTFTAVCAIDDLRAFGVIRALFDAGLRVPEDVSVIGFDDLAISRYFNPTLTTIAQPLDKLGQSAAEALLTQMKLGEKQGEQPGKAVSSRTLRPSLVERRSTRAL
jgi:DNA-binding LacI/PurR family transcriptional regulator